MKVSLEFSLLKNLEWMKSNIIWRLALGQLLLHVGIVYGFYLIFSLQMKVATILWGVFVWSIGGIGTSLGSHRYFSHRSFKATRGLKIFLIFCQTVSGEFSIHYWVRTHRLHHKFTDTDRDPTNVNRGFFFAYCGYYFLPRHPDCLKEWKRVDVSDLDSDKDIMFQYKFYETLWTIFCIGLPTLVPCIFWNELFYVAFWGNIMRYALNFSHLGLANSVSHMFGSQPYDKSMSARDNVLLNFWMFGEGYHNFHHCFPQDYRCSDNMFFNKSTGILETFRDRGWAYDLKITSDDVIRKRAERSGDGSHFIYGQQ